MNILPKKRWHVRTKDNIARVRRDEAKAAEEEKKLKMRIQLAEQESKLKLLRNKSKQRYDSSAIADQSEEIKSELPSHVNFFQDLEDGHIAHTGVNKEHEQEKKDEKEAYEKKIGYLTYLGQDTDEITGNVQWYNKKPKRLELSTTDKEIETKVKTFNDPLLIIKKYVENDEKNSKNSKELVKKIDNNPIKKHKKKKKKKEKEKEKSKEKVKEEKKLLLEQLREKRLKREREERFRASQLLAKINGVEPIEVPKSQPKPIIVQKYNSQFNPYLAKQNYATNSNANYNS